MYAQVVSNAAAKPSGASSDAMDAVCRVRISSTDVIEGRRVLYKIGKISAASAWHAANGTQDSRRELVLTELMRRAEDIDADAIIGFDYETDGIVSDGVQLKRPAARRHGLGTWLARPPGDPCAHEEQSLSGRQILGVALA